MRLEGWKEIAVHIRRSRRWCIFWAASSWPSEDRLPAYRLGGMVCAESVDVDTWLERRKAKGLDRIVSCV